MVPSVPRVIGIVFLTLALGLPAYADIGTDWLSDQRTQDGAYARAADTVTAYQATAETLRLAHLRGATVSFDQVGALAYLDAEVYTGTEYLARRVVARAQAGKAVSHLLPALGEHQGADGGFAELPGFESSVLDTAFALDALAVAGRHLSAEAGLALAYLAERQNPNGGWGASRDGGSSVYVTALVLQALTPYQPHYAVSVPLAKAHDFLLGARNVSYLWGETYLSAISLLALIPVVDDHSELAPSLTSLRLAQSADGSWNGDVYATALALRALALAEVPTPNPALAELGGQVIDGDSGLPLSGVSAELSGVHNAEVVTRADGNFRFTGLPPGRYELTLSLDEYGGLSTITTLAAGDKLALGSLAMIRSTASGTGTLYGKVTEAASGQPLANVLIATSQGQTAQTGVDGTFQITHLAPGSMTLNAELAGYESAFGSVHLSPGGSVVFSPALLPSQIDASVYGWITDAVTGQPLPGAGVEVSGSTESGALTDNDGHYRIDHVAPGAISLTVSRAGYDAVTAGTLVHAGQQIVFSPALYPQANTPPGANSASIVGRVMDSTSGEALSGVSIEAVHAGEARVMQSDANGSFSVEGIVTAELILRFRLDGYRSVELSLPVEPLAVKDVGQVRLRPLSVEFLLPDLVVAAMDTVDITTDAQTLTLSGTLEVVIANRGTRPVESAFDVLAFYDANVDGDFDKGTDALLGETTVTETLQTEAEAAVSVELGGVLPFRDAPITVWADSGGSVVEQDEANNGADSAGQCRQFASGLFDPVLKWHWTQPVGASRARHVFGPPMVGQLSDDNGDGRIDSRDMPDLVFVDSAGTLNVVSGADGRELVSVSGLSLTHSGSLALGDIDDDGVVEILGTDRRNRQELLALEHDGSLKWRVSRGPPERIYTSQTSDGIAIADLDADGVPEIVHGDRVFSPDGVLLWIGGWDRGGYAAYGYLSIVADIDLDGTQEVVAGRSVYDHAGNLVWHRGEFIGDGFNAVGNFDEDDTAEIVLVAFGELYLLEHDGTLIWGPVAVPGTGIRGGPPTVADFDNDGAPEIGVAGYDRYVAFDTDGSVLWQAPVKDHSSARTGSSVFDFENDGRAEVLYADEIYFRVYDGASGEVRVEIPNGSGTRYEYPVVADIDNDGAADIVVPSSSVPAGVRVFESASGSWAGTRALWNQHSYHITNIADDGSIPPLEQPSWLHHNSYRLNTLLDRDPLAAPDLSLAQLRLVDNGTGAPFALEVRAGSGGATGPAGAVTLAFYQGDPDAGGVALGSLNLQGLSAPEWRDLRLDGVTLSGTDDIYAIIDPQDLIRECKETNNRVSTPLSTTPALGAIQVSSDADTYPPNTSAVLHAVVRNRGSFAADYRVALRIEDAAGATVAELSPRMVTALAAGTEESLRHPWNTAATLAGDYVLHGQLFDGDQRLLAEATSHFAIQAGEGPSLSLRTTLDRPRYHTADRVGIATLIRNLTENTLFEHAALRVSVTDPVGQEVQRQTSPLGQLPPGATRKTESFYVLTQAVPGQYRVLGEVLDGAGVVLARHSVPFEVAHSIQRSLSGEVTAQFDRRYVGEQQICTDRIVNNAPFGLESLSIRRLLTRVDQPREIDAVTTQIALPAGGMQTLVRSIDSASLAPGDYACVLQALLDTAWTSLDFDDFRVDAPLIDVVLDAGGGGRVLILLDSPPRGNGAGGDPHGRGPALADQHAYLRDLLRRHGGSHTLVTHQEAFANELYSGGYTRYALLGEQEKLDERVQKALREAVFRGEGLLVAGGHDQRHHGLQSALGIAFRGKHPKASGLRLEAGGFAAPGYSPFALADSPLKAETTRAVTVGRFEGCRERPAPAAVTSHDYGWGRAVYGGFDLLAQATQAGGDNLFSGLILDALAHIQPDALWLGDGAVIPLSLTLANQAGPSVIEAQLVLPARATLVDPGSAQRLPDGRLRWHLDLAEQATVVLELWIRLPGGSHTVTVDVGAVQAGQFASITSSRLSLHIPPAQTLSEVIELAAARAAAAEQGPYQPVFQRLERAAHWLERGDSAKALAALIEATEPLQDAPCPQSFELRGAIDRQIWYTARALADE